MKTKSFFLLMVFTACSVLTRAGELGKSTGGADRARYGSVYVSGDSADLVSARDAAYTFAKSVHRYIKRGSISLEAAPGTGNNEMKFNLQDGSRCSASWDENTACSNKGHPGGPGWDFSCEGPVAKTPDYKSARHNYADCYYGLAN